jgi:hypothetical protein
MISNECGISEVIVRGFLRFRPFTSGFSTEVSLSIRVRLCVGLNPITLLRSFSSLRCMIFLFILTRIIISINSIAKSKLISLLIALK